MSLCHRHPLLLLLPAHPHRTRFVADAGRLSSHADAASTVPSGPPRPAPCAHAAVPAPALLCPLCLAPLTDAATSQPVRARLAGRPRYGHPTSTPRTRMLRLSTHARPPAGRTRPASAPAPLLKAPHCVLCDPAQALRPLAPMRVSAPVRFAHTRIARTAVLALRPPAHCLRLHSAPPPRAARADSPANPRRDVYPRLGHRCHASPPRPRLLLPMRAAPLPLVSCLSFAILCLVAQQADEAPSSSPFASNPIPRLSCTAMSCPASRRARVGAICRGPMGRRLRETCRPALADCAPTSCLGLGFVADDASRAARSAASAPRRAGLRATRCVAGGSAEGAHHVRRSPACPPCPMSCPMSALPQDASQARYREICAPTRAFARHASPLPPLKRSSIRAQALLARPRAASTSPHAYDGQQRED
ncbi:hypothetical protein B0H15DRAFT_1000836 [Mycena belliarum]|uniref:Uncharacterized protein n=1 Tax=Mycena belliarum TaxID=1033014 RepID=A0AAD6XLL5_9AGAR|nr:hypothetical protein B0H15DRAFT_1000836 [Mycena belliae]